MLTSKSGPNNIGDMMNKPIACSIILLAALTLLSGCQPDGNATMTDVQNSPSKSETVVPAAQGNAGPVNEPKDLKAMNFEQLLPADYLVMAKSLMRNGDVCLAGAKLADEGAEAAHIYRINSEQQKIIWQTPIKLDADFYQNRLTHCSCNDTTCYALVATDTQPQQSLSQTLLSLVAISAADGKIIHQRPIGKIPGASDSMSAWVEPGDNNFVVKNNVIEINGKFRDMDSSNEQEFSLTVNQNLTQGEQL